MNESNKPNQGKRRQPGDYRDLLDHLTRARTELAPQLRKAACYILNNTGMVATLSMRKLAAAADVPPPTLPRLASNLGYETYDRFRDVFRAHLQDQASGYAQQAGRLQRHHASDDLGTLIGEFRGASFSNIERFFATLDAELVQETVKALRSARTVYVIGMQASHAPAFYFHYVGVMAQGNWVLLESSDGDMARQAAGMGAEDLLVAIAMPPSASQSIAMAEFAKARGTPIVGITSTRASSLAARADRIFVVPTESPQYFESFVATVLLLEILIGLTVADGGRTTVDSIERAERARRELGEYWEGD